ncbi:M13 family peptidase, partial [Gammaproteobacteria bacterium]|nr:M13 family peptidase [Gammaproteobacteria bacterium]
MNTKMKLLPAIIALSLGFVACSDESAPVASSSDTPETVLANAKPELGDFGIDLSQQDPNTKPGDDFFRFANGKWLDEFELPADRSNYGSFSVLGDRSDERVNTIIEELSAAEPAADTIEQKISDYYLSYMNTEVLDERGIGPLREKLAQLSAIDSRAALIAALGRSQLDATASPFGWYVGADRRDPDRHQLVLSLGGIGLPDRDYYLLDTEQYVSARSEYVAHIEHMLGFAGIENAAEKAQAVLALETAFAENLWPRADRRNRDLTFNPMTYTEFKAAYPNMDWDAYWAAAGISEIEDLNVSYPSAMAPIIALVDSVAVEDWVSYMSYQHISNLASVLSQEIDDENFHFYSTVLNGVPEQRQRWERGVERVGSLNSLGEAVGQIYVQKHFPEAAKQQMQGLVENLRTALANSIASLDWMGEETKNEARLKLESFRPKIAYPDEWRDLSSIEISRDDLFANARSLREFNYADEISRLGKPTNREEWGMTPQTVN